MAPLLGVASAIYVKVLGWVEVRIYRVPSGLARFLPPVGMAVVGLVAIRFPDLLGNGYDTVKSALLGDMALPLLFALPFLKLAASALCAGVGVPGGLFTPSLFYGALLGGGFGELARRVFPALGGPPARSRWWGWRACSPGRPTPPSPPCSSSSSSPATTGSSCRSCSRRSSPPRRPRDRAGLAVHRAAAAAGGEAPRAAASRVAQGDARRRAPLRDPQCIPPSMPFKSVLPRLLALPPANDLYVTGEAGELLGVIALDALKGNIPDEGLLGMIVAADVMDEDVRPITTAMTLAEVAARFAEEDLERLPVVDDRGVLVGSSRSAAC